MEKLNLIMLSAMYENGGNTTHRLLDGHPELFVYPFESQVGTGFNNDYLSSYVPIRYRWPEFAMDGNAASDYEAFWDEEYKTLARVPKRSKFNGIDFDISEDERKRIFIEDVERDGRTRANLVHAYYHSLFAAWRNVQRTGREKFYVGYNPVQILDCEKILADFPQGHVLHVVRNPWSGYADTKKRPFPISLSRYAWTWNLCQHKALVHKERHPDRVHILRFEDIVADTKKTLGGFFEKIGLEWSDTALYPSWNAQKLEAVFPWGTIRTPTPEANMATLEELSEDEKREMAGHTCVMGRLLGYDDLLARWNY